MTGATLNYADIARRMLTHDAPASKTAAACAAAVSGVNQQLNHRLAPLIGVNGMRALFARSLKVTSGAFPALVELRGPEFGDNADMAQPLLRLVSELESGAAWAAATALYANLLALTASLIGERLVLLVLKRAFPNLDVTAKAGAFSNER